MKKLIFLFSAAILAALGCSKNGSEDKNIQIEDTSGARLPVLAWVGVPSAQTSVERYREMADAGFTWSFPWDLCHNLDENSITPQPYIKDINEYIKALDAAQAAGMKILVASGVLDYFTGDDLRRIREHPALLGYVIIDEPKSSQFDALGEQTRHVQAVDPDHLPYINLNPTYAFKTTEEYRTHVQDFTAKVPMPFLSFDHYAVVQDRVEKLLEEWDFKTAINPNPRKIRPDFFENLEIISDEARKAGKPFWAFALSTWHIGSHEYPIPTMNDLRFYVYNSLAYGAQCIEYFSYWALHFGKEAPIEKEGQKTLTYYNVCRMNEEIKNLSKVFLNATVVWKAHTGVIPQGCRELDKKQLPDVFQSLEVSGTGALVSLLEKGNDRFLVIVNHDINHTVNVQASMSPRVRRVSKDGSVVAAGAGQNLDPGDAVIYFWKKNNTNKLN
jgi:hypothetical protein